MPFLMRLLKVHQLSILYQLKKKERNQTGFTTKFCNHICGNSCGANILCHSSLLRLETFKFHPQFDSQQHLTGICFQPSDQDLHKFSHINVDH